MFLIPTHLTFYVSYQNILLHYVMSSMISMHTCCCTCIIGVLSFVPNVKTSALYTLSRNLFCYVIRMSTLIFFYIIIKIFIKCFFYFSILLFVSPNFVFFLCMNRQKHSHSKQIVKIITIHLRFIIVISPLLISGMSTQISYLVTIHHRTRSAFRAICIGITNLKAFLISRIYISMDTWRCKNSYPVSTEVVIVVPHFGHG